MKREQKSFKTFSEALVEDLGRLRADINNPGRCREARTQMRRALSALLDSRTLAPETAKIVDQLEDLPGFLMRSDQHELGRHADYVIRQLKLRMAEEGGAPKKPGMSIDTPIGPEGASFGGSVAGI